MRQSPTAYLATPGKSGVTDSWRRLATFDASHLVLSNRRWAKSLSSGARSARTSGLNDRRYHGTALPPQSQLIGHLFAGDSRLRRKGVLQASSDGIAQRQP